MISFLPFSVATFLWVVIRDFTAMMQMCVLWFHFSFVVFSENCSCDDFSVSTYINCLSIHFLLERLKWPVPHVLFGCQLLPSQKRSRTELCLDCLAAPLSQPHLLIVSKNDSLSSNKECNPKSAYRGALIINDIISKKWVTQPYISRTRLHGPWEPPSQKGLLCSHCCLAQLVS